MEDGRLAVATINGADYTVRILTGGPVAYLVRVVGLDTTAPLWGTEGIVRAEALQIPEVQH